MKMDMPSHLAAHGLTNKGANTRTRIMGLARRILIDEGYDALTLRDLARRGGMQLGNLQYYFPTRDLLLAAIITSEAERDVAAIDQAGDGTGEPVHGLLAIVSELVRRWRGDSGIVYGVLIFLTLHKPVFRVLRQDVYTSFHVSLARLVRQIDPQIDEAACDMRVTLMTALMDGAAVQAQIGEPRACIEAVAKTALGIARGAGG